METIILGSGISGISAGYHLLNASEPVVIYEKDGDWGGLCGILLLMVLDLIDLCILHLHQMSI